MYVTKALVVIVLNIKIIVKYIRLRITHFVDFALYNRIPFSSDNMHITIKSGLNIWVTALGVTAAIPRIMKSIAHRVMLTNRILLFCLL